jgi:hypothetical protein
MQEQNSDHAVNPRKALHLKEAGIFPEHAVYAKTDFVLGSEHAVYPR